MATYDLQGGGAFAGSPLGTALTDLLMCPEIQPGSEPSYQICKEILLYHPIGRKMVATPVKMAQSQQRDIVIPEAPEDRVRQAFLDQWKAHKADKRIANTTCTSRTYGVSALVVVLPDDDPSQPLDFRKLATAPVVGFNVLDPLNTSGSFGVLNQDPNSIGFQQATGVRVAGTPYHPSRACMLVNEDPVYIAFTGSAFAFTGRSVFQRALFPLKSFIQSMRTDDLVVRKAGVIIAKIKQVGSLVDNVMSRVVGQKRAIAKEAITDDVMSIGEADTVESLNLQNLEGPYTLARKNIIENLASASDMPAKILNSQTFAEGFGEGTEDAKDVARYVDSVREDMQPAYDFMDAIIQYRAWTPAFYETIQAEFPDQYAGKPFETAFYEWRNSFKATWPSLLIEPESERVVVEKTKFEAATAAVTVLLPAVDPENRVKVLDWYAQLFNEAKLLFPVRLDLDLDALENYVPPAAELQPGEQEEEQEPKPEKPFADSVVRLTDGKRA